jgi:glyoxylase-like metal-dependent hydrolase (beta-lactamase superfamily II)
VNERIALVRAPNPSAMTLSGTNSYLIDGGDGEAVCIDPGPPIERHVEALLHRAAEMKCRIALICLTHTHPDHAPAAAMLAQRTGAPVAASEKTQYAHDRSLHDMERIMIGSTAIVAMASPGHTFDHLVYYDERDAALFTGDMVLGSGFVVIAPPNGAMRPYQHSLRRMIDAFPDVRTIYGGHGEPVHDPRAKIAEYLAHRTAREGELLQALARGSQSIPQLVQSIYRDTNKLLWPAAARQMLAYLLALEQEGRVRSHALDRELTPSEHAILNPEWETIVGEEHARTVAEELGAMLRLDQIRIYELVN